MAVEASLRGDGCRLVVRVERYEFPEETTGSDANWLEGEVELTVGSSGSFRALEPVFWRTDELEWFRDALSALVAAGAGEATLDHMELQVLASVRLEAGHGTLAASVCQHIGAELRVEGIETDQAAVRDALADFDALVRAFPVRGDPG